MVDALLDVGVDVILALIDMFGIGVAAQIFAHLFGKIHHHLIMQGADLVLGMQIVQLLDVKIAEAEGLFQFHAVLAAQPGDHGRGDDKMVFQIHHRVPGKLAHSLIFSKAALFAVAAHIIHIAVGHRPVELVFFAGIPVLHLIHFIVGFQKQPFLLVTHLTPAFCGSERCRPGGTAGIFCFHYTTNRRFPQRPGDFFCVKKLHFGQKAVMDLIFFVRF